MADIFDHCWLYLCHESQVAEHGDYIATRMGRHPVFVIRGSDGELGVVIQKLVQTRVHVHPSLDRAEHQRAHRRGQSAAGGGDADEQHVGLGQGVEGVYHRQVASDLEQCLRGLRWHGGVEHAHYFIAPKADHTARGLGGVRRGEPLSEDENFARHAWRGW